MQIDFFTKGDLFQFLRQRHQEIINEVRAFERDYLLNVSEEDICKYLIEKHRLEPVKIFPDKKEIVENKPVMLQRPGFWGEPVNFEGQAIVIAVPFEGDPILFNYQPSAFVMRYDSAVIAGHELHFHYEVAGPEAQQLGNEIGNSLSSLEQNLANVERHVQTYNQNLSAHVRSTVVERKRKLLDQLKTVQSLNIPLRHRRDASQIYAIPTVKRKPRIERPAASSVPFTPEWELLMEEYEYILNVAQNMAIMLERSPSTFAKLGEEEIRDHFLVQLNGHFEGQATAETFNHHGKTDIIIKYKDRNVFIAECKFWDGAKVFTDAIEQLLGYTSWRDTKTAIFLFNKNKDTSKVLKQIPEIVKAHSNYKRESPGRLDETRFRFILHQPGDTNREIYLTVCVYDIPSEPVRD